MDRRQLGQLIQERRLACRDPERPDKPLSVRGLARLVGVDHATISFLEKGARGVSPELIARIDDALDAGGSLTEAAGQIPAPAGRWPQIVPTQLPPEHQPLIGRDGLIAEILDEAGQAADGAVSAPLVLVLAGPGGVGKTAVMVTVAHRLADVDGSTGALWADLRGWDDSSGPRPAETVLRSWCKALGAPDQAVGGDLDDLAGLFRTLSAERQLVVGIDNARADQVGLLIPASPRSTVLVTTRDRMVSVTNVRRFEIRPLDNDAATRLLSFHARMSESAVEPMVSRCAGLPLALRVAGEDAAAHWTEGGISEMATAYDAADELTPIDRATRLSYNRLSDDARRAWRLCALTGGDVSLGQAAAIVGSSGPETRRLLTEAADGYLLDTAGGTWAYHDLHRAFALRASRVEDSTGARDEALYRGLTWCLHGLARSAVHIANRDDTPVSLVELPDGVEPPEISDYEGAMAWTDAHWITGPAPVRAAIDRGWTALAWQLVASAISYMYIAKANASWDAAAREALDAARVAGDNEGLAFMHHVRGLVAGDRGDYPRAVRHLLAGLELRRSLGPAHNRDRGWSAINAARFVFANGGSDEEINPLIDETIQAHETIGYKAGIVLGHAFRGALAARRGDWAAAAELLNAAMDGTPEVGDPAITSYVGAALADAQLHLGHTENAAQAARQADQVARENQAEWYRISPLSILATTNPESARTSLRLAISLAEKLGDPREAELRQRLDDLGPEPDGDA